MDKYLDYMVEQVVNLAKIPSPTGYAHKAVAYTENIIKD